MNIRRYLYIGAHPDDPDEHFGASAIKLCRAGHIVKFVSVSNGDKGHFKMQPEELAARRKLEAAASAKIAGIADYEVLDNHDGELTASLKQRFEIIRLIRRFQPDVVISNRICDYHPDHRATAQLVMDSAYMIGVPHCCSDTQIPSRMPVFASSFDCFKSPQPFRADAAVAVDDVLEEKIAMLACHVSQFFEWLPWDKGYRDFDVGKMSHDEKRQWLLDNWMTCYDRAAADAGRETLRKCGFPNAVCAETFEQSEYGRQVSNDEFQELFV